MNLVSRGDSPRNLVKNARFVDFQGVTGRGVIKKPDLPILNDPVGPLEQVS